MSDPSGDSIHCNLCGTAMERGKVTIGQTVSGFLAAGMALPLLFFESFSGEKTSVFGWKDADAAAHRCPGCGVVMLQGRRE